MDSLNFHICLFYFFFLLKFLSSNSSGCVITLKLFFLFLWARSLFRRIWYFIVFSVGPASEWVRGGGGWYGTSRPFRPIDSWVCRRCSALLMRMHLFLQLCLHFRSYSFRLDSNSISRSGVEERERERGREEGREGGIDGWGREKKEKEIWKESSRFG